MGLGKIFTKKCAKLHVLFAVETNLSFWWDLEKFSQKSVPSHTVFRSAGYLKFLMGLGKNFTKKCAQLHVLFAVETNLSFWWDLKKFSQKKCAQSQVSSLWRLTWVFDATWKNVQKNVLSHRFLRCADYLKFLMGLGKIFTKKCTQSHVSSLWRLTWVFDAT